MLVRDLDLDLDLDIAMRTFVDYSVYKILCDDARRVLDSRVSFSVFAESGFLCPSYIAHSLPGKNINLCTRPGNRTHSLHLLIISSSEIFAIFISFANCLLVGLTHCVSLRCLFESNGVSDLETCLMTRGFEMNLPFLERDCKRSGKNPSISLGGERTFGNEMSGAKRTHG